MAHKTVVRNAAYSRGSVGIRQRHNERENESYSNADIQLERSSMNVHFRQCGGTYEQAFDELLDDELISTRGWKSDAKIIDEMIFDVNTLYFEERGGYEYAKKFYEEAYRLAIKEAGDERYILSAVMHADERNVAISEEMGKDVYHYHLHVIYVPVVEKEIKWTKRCKDKDLVGKVKEVINQVSHSKKWPRFRGEDGKWVNSYSLLQDRFYEHMKDAGFKDFERGERGSTAEHLSDMNFKLKKDKERAKKLDEKITVKEKKIQKLDDKVVVLKKQSDVFADIDRMSGKRTIMGDVAVSQPDWKTVSNLAKEGQKSRGIIQNLKDKINNLLTKIHTLEQRLEQYETKKLTISDSMKFYQALNRAPKRMWQAIADIMKNPPEQTRQMSQIQKERGNDYGR